jgi:TetR/AcrR family transcriptional regulator, tetracycline repressor protein
MALGGDRNMAGRAARVLARGRRFAGRASLDRIAHRMAFLVASGVPEQHARTAMSAAGRFTVGSVLEEQADAGPGDSADRTAGTPPMDHEFAFEAGLALILQGRSSR